MPSKFFVGRGPRVAAGRLPDAVEDAFRRVRESAETHHRRKKLVALPRPTPAPSSTMRPITVDTMWTVYTAIRTGPRDQAARAFDRAFGDWRDPVDRPAFFLSLRTASDAMARKWFVDACDDVVAPIRHSYKR